MRADRRSGDRRQRGVRPARNFDFGNGHSGAFQIAARYHTLKIDDRAFTSAWPAPGSSRKAEAWTAGLNWYLTPELPLRRSTSSAPCSTAIAMARARPRTPSCSARRSISRQHVGSRVTPDALSSAFSRSVAMKSHRVS